MQYTKFSSRIGEGSINFGDSYAGLVFGFTVLDETGYNGRVSAQIDERYARLEVHHGYYADLGSKTLIEMEQISSDREDHEVYF